MNYDRYAADPIHSPMFNGNASSMGGNGLPTNYTGIPQKGKTPDLIPSGGGGGCVTEGPFKEYRFCYQAPYSRCHDRHFADRQTKNQHGGQPGPQVARGRQRAQEPAGRRVRP